jgi:hypothetical protein
MAKLKRLLDIYRFPGFVPRPKVRGIFGDPLAVVITLQRRRKKRSAGSAAGKRMESGWILRIVKPDPNGF